VRGDEWWVGDKRSYEEAMTAGRQRHAGMTGFVRVIGMRYWDC
jgi:hypothetical protein